MMCVTQLDSDLPFLHVVYFVQFLVPCCFVEYSTSFLHTFHFPVHGLAVGCYFAVLVLDNLYLCVFVCPVCTVAILIIIYLYIS